MDRDNCCLSPVIQWWPDPNAPGQYNLVCSSCGAVWKPGPAPSNFEAAILEKLDVLATVVTEKLPIEGGGVYEQAWTNLVESVATKTTWGKKTLKVEMDRVLAELQPAADDSNSDDLPF